MTNNRRLQYICASAICGGFWFLLPLTLDKCVEDYNYPLLPTSNFFSFAASIAAGMITGVIIAVVFQRLFLCKSRPLFFILPIFIIPTAITIFCTLIWFVWLLFRLRFEVTELLNIPGLYKTPGLREILSMYLMYGLAFSPILYGFALLSQWVFRRLLKRN